MTVEKLIKLLQKGVAKSPECAKFDVVVDRGFEVVEVEFHFIGINKCSINGFHTTKHNPLQMHKRT